MQGDCIFFWDMGAILNLYSVQIIVTFVNAAFISWESHGSFLCAGFTAYLLSEECDVFETEHKVVCQDMSHPLAHYFISSSHNT